MTQYDQTCKALVVYTPPVVRNKSFCKKVICNFYESRSVHYYFLLLCFVMLSVFARCMHVRAPQIHVECLNDIHNAYQVSGFNFGLVVTFVKLPIIYSLLAFFSGFTVFSKPISFAVVINFFYTVSFTFFGCIDKFFRQDFIICFAYLAVFSVYIVISTAFFTEAHLFNSLYSDTEMAKKKKHVIVYSLLFVLYFGITLLFSHINLRLLLNP